MRIQSRPSPLSTEGLGTRLRWCRAVVSFSLDDYTDTGTDASDVGDAHSIPSNLIERLFDCGSQAYVIDSD